MTPRTLDTRLVHPEQDRDENQIALLRSHVGTAGRGLRTLDRRRHAV